MILPMVAAECFVGGAGMWLYVDSGRWPLEPARRCYEWVMGIVLICFGCRSCSR